MPGMWTTADHIDLLRRSLKTAVPYTSGVQALRKEDLGLFYRSAQLEEEKGAARYIDFSEGPSEESLAQLASACQKATFGSEAAEGDVLDEEYRKAGKIDVKDFSARLDIAAAGILDAIAPELLVSQDMKGKALRAEMYKLNVYGPGSFFKAHKDTPRGDNMLGSLVVVLPTRHEGGALTLSQNESKWVFDSASQLQAHSGSSVVAYVAFFSDVTHTVEPVTAGYRVTLTYNLFVTPASAPTTRITPPPELACETSLRALLADPKWFPKGGHLAFGLTHQYPMPRPYANSYSRSRNQSFIDTALLKGCDARLRNAAVRAGLQPQVRLMYRIREDGYAGSPALIVMDDPVEIGDVYEEFDMDFEIQEQGTIFKEVNERGRVPSKGTDTERAAKRQKTGEDEAAAEPEEDAREEDGEPVYWVTPPGEKNEAESGYGGYMGNDYGQGFVYGHAELFVRIPKVGEEGREVSADDDQ
ncbi:Fe2OG dioxygenase domain-containing protein [Mycena indigotica]|uniref:Fe2OG dioxygenase domain-containing protein n=1 Tax=Mycena indigotica TaxID=2126181 RepID=A0A8H6VRJ9_9AGAR|nr:Fe2OG dioxygenase domain-containing protein [Mycena indigotica]KAF7291194.1 Fe2OG dioxygenase domain-containing protein [Mycena indigotica]